jgi:Rad3-related DNA helicase
LLLQAVDAARSGRHVVVSTSTASGKSLCYLLPVLEALAADRRATALFMFPTKALAQVVARLDITDDVSTLRLDTCAGSPHMVCFCSARDNCTAEQRSCCDDVAQDQLRAMRQLLEAAFGDDRPFVDVYDGDTPKVSVHCAGNCPQPSDDQH